MHYREFLKKNWAVLLCFSLLVFIMYGQSFYGKFVYDDRNIVEHAEMLISPARLGQTVMSPFWNEESGLYRPTTLLSYFLNFSVFGNGPASFHLINLILYILVCFFIYLFIKKLFGNEIWAFGAGLLFLLFPIHTEVVANISGRGELLALFFSLLVLLEFVKEKPSIWLIFLWTLLGMGSKETALAMFPLIFLVLYIKEKRINTEIAKKYFRSVASSLIAICFYFFLRFWSLGPAHFLGVKTSLIENPLMFAGAGPRIITSFKVLWMYFEKMLWPANLCSDYSYNQIPIIHNFFNLGSILGFGLFVSSIVLIFVLIKRAPEISLGLGIFIFSFLPISNIFFPTGTIAGERLFFFPSFGFALVISFLVYKIFSLNKKDFITTVLVVAVTASLGIYGLVTLERQSVWLNEETLFFSAARCAPNSVLARSNAGAEYLLRGDLTKAQEELEIARDIKPIYSKGLNNLGLVYFRKGDNVKARELYLEAIKQDFPYGGAYENLVLLYLKENKLDLVRHWLTYLYGNNKKLIDGTIENYLKVIR